MKSAIMQPYLFPYIGYFQLITTVDHFVFYDDVSFIKRGWINRNRILINGKDELVTIPLIKASQNKLINEIDIFCDANLRKKFISKIEYAYKKAPFYEEVIELIRNIVNADISNIGEYAANSVVSVSNYLEINTQFHFSSILSPESKGMDKADRLIHICQNLETEKYINSIGGQVLYKKKYFLDNQIDLSFIETLDFEYKQFEKSFVPLLSIIDILMFNSKESVKSMLDNYTLI
jgi:hypothetical protein